MIRCPKDLQAISTVRNAQDVLQERAAKFRGGRLQQERQQQQQQQPLDQVEGLEPSCSCLSPTSTMSTPVPTLLRVKPSKASESDWFNERYGKRAHEKAVELGYALPVFHTHDVDVNYYRQQQELRKKQEPRKRQDLQKQQELQKRQDLQKQQEQQEQQKQQELQELQEQKTQLIQQKRQKKRLRRREEREELEELRKQKVQQKQQEQQKQQQHVNETPPPRVAIALPPIQPLLYPPPGPEEEWSEQQVSEWQWQQFFCYMQQGFQEKGEEFQNQHPQWQQFYRQYQLQYWHRQQAQYYASLSRLTLPDPADLFRLSAPPEFFVTASNPGIGQVAASLNSHAAPAASLASLALPAHLPATRPSLKRSRSLSPPRGRAESSVHGSRRPLVPSLASTRLSPGHRNDYARPLAPPVQPRDAVIGPPSSIVALTTYSEASTSPDTTVPGLAHGLPVSQFSSNDVGWPVLTETEFAKMMNAQQQWQQQVTGIEDVWKCEE
jgi:hypothetical protein